MLNGGTGADIFAFSQLSSSQSFQATIQDFQDGSDKIRISGDLDYSDINIKASGSSTVVTFDNGPSSFNTSDSITLNNIAAKLITASDFIFE